MDSVAEQSDEQTSPSEDAGGAGFSQEDIDALVDGGSDASAEGAPPAEGAPDEAAADEGGEVDQAAIDAMFGGGEAEAGAGDAAAPEPEGAGDPPPVNQADIDALVESAADGPADDAPSEPDSRTDTLGRPFDEAAAAMQAAIEEERIAAEAAAVATPAPEPFVPAPPPPGSQPVSLPDLSSSANESEAAKRVTMLNDVALKVRLQLGQTTMLVEDVLGLGEGSVVELDKLAGDPVDVLVNGRLIARGEVLVLNDSFCVRISEVLSNDPHRITT